MKMKNFDVNKFVKFCKENLDLSNSANKNFETYESLPECIVDCVYSLRAKYYSVTIPVVRRYQDYFLKGSNVDNTLSAFINDIQSIGYLTFAENIVKNKQKLNGIMKSEVCCNLASALTAYNIETKEDFQNKPAKDLEKVILSAKGIGKAGTNYLFMLSGDPNRCKPDVHIHNFILDACGESCSDDECQIIFTKAVEQLRSEGYSELTVRGLDRLVWDKYRKGERGNLLFYSCATTTKDYLTTMFKKTNKKGMFSIARHQDDVAVYTAENMEDTAYIETFKMTWDKSSYQSVLNDFNDLEKDLSKVEDFIQKTNGKLYADKVRSHVERLQRFLKLGASEIVINLEKCMLMESMAIHKFAITKRKTKI